MTLNYVEVSIKDAEAHGLNFGTRGRLIRAHSGSSFIAGTLSDVGSRKFGEASDANKGLPSRPKLLVDVNVSGMLLL